MHTCVITYQVYTMRCIALLLMKTAITTTDAMFGCQIKWNQRFKYYDHKHNVQVTQPLYSLETIAFIRLLTTMTTINKQPLYLYVRS